VALGRRGGACRKQAGLGAWRRGFSLAGRGDRAGRA
jgi:hypothetical protein